MEYESIKQQINHPAIILQCVREDGERERTRLTHHTMQDARELAKWVLYAGNGFYTVVEICIEDGVVETVQDSEVMDHVRMYGASRLRV